MGCPACLLALFADAPSFANLIQEAKASPHGKICVCADCRSVMGADAARSLRSPAPSRANILRSILGGDESSGAGSGSTSGSLGIGAGDGTGAGINVASDTGGDTGSGSSSSGSTGIDLSQLAAMAGTADPAKIAAFVAALTGKAGAAQPPPVIAPAQNKAADETHIWVIALFVLAILTIFVLSKSHKK